MIKWSKLRASGSLIATMTAETFHNAIFRIKNDSPPIYLTDARRLGKIWTAKVNSELLDLMEKDDNILTIEISYYYSI